MKKIIYFAKLMKIKLMALLMCAENNTNQSRRFEDVSETMRPTLFRATL